MSSLSTFESRPSLAEAAIESASTVSIIPNARITPIGNARLPQLNDLVPGVVSTVVRRPGGSDTRAATSAIPRRLPAGPPSDLRLRSPRRRSVSNLLRPLVPRLSGPGFVKLPSLPFKRAGESHELPRYRFVGPSGGGTITRLAIFATIHGDEPESGLGLVRFLQELTRRPELAQGFDIHAYPICNPTGFEDGIRNARSGPDLNREFWRGSREPEVRLLEQELLENQFHGMVSLHCDDTSHGLYGFLSGRQPSAVLSAHLLEPALLAAERFLPRNLDAEIDGFRARGGVLSSCYDGVLRSPADQAPPPFEITFETPQHASVVNQVEAFNAALISILVEIRSLLAHAPNL